MFAKITIAPDSPCEDAVKKLIDAVKITIPDLSWDDIASYRLSYNEITIIGEIASKYFAAGEREKALKTLQCVKTSMDMHYIDEQEKSLTYPMLLFKLSCFLRSSGRYDEALELCEAGKRMAIRYNRPRILPYLLHSIASALKGKVEMKTSVELIKQAYHTARAMENYSYSEMIRKDARRNFSMNLR